MHLSTGHEGGAGIAARSLSKGLSKHGITSHFYSLKNSKYFPEENEFYLNRGIEKILGSSFTFLNSKYSKRVFFSLFSADSISFHKELFNDYDIIHIHNWYNLISISSLDLLMRIEKPVVFTLHDERLLTGGCHYTLKCRKFETNCFACPELPLGLNLVPFFQYNRLQHKLQNSIFKIFISPSSWLISEFKKISSMREKEIVKIPNYLDFDAMSDSDKMPDISLNKGGLRRIGIASVHPYSYIKGGNFLKRLETYLTQNKIPLKLFYLSDFFGKRSNVQNFWNNIDALLVPSVLDNAPNVIFEAKYFGKPVIGSNTGGIPEIIDKEVDMLIDFENQSIENICNQIINFNPFKIDLLKSRNYLLDMNGTSINLHLGIYKKILN